MEKFLDIYSKYRDYILSFLLLIIFVLVQGLFFWYFSNEINSVRNTKEKVVSTKKVSDKSSTKLIVDIKGEVKRPGVYYLDSGKRVIDVVRKAGGFTINADSSINNLSKKIKDEMVIVIYSKSEVRDYLATKEKNEFVSEMCNGNIVNDSCISDENRDISSSVNKENSNKNGNSNSSDSKKLISINSGTLEELMTLSGVGESKAKAIIEYRNKKKFETIEEIKEVSGIGDALFEKIKDNITV